MSRPLQVSLRPAGAAPVASVVQHERLDARPLGELVAPAAPSTLRSLPLLRRLPHRGVGRVPLPRAEPLGLLRRRGQPSAPRDPLRREASQPRPEASALEELEPARGAPLVDDADVGADRGQGHGLIVTSCPGPAVATACSARGVGGFHSSRGTLRSSRLRLLGTCTLLVRPLRVPAALLPAARRRARSPLTR